MDAHFGRGAVVGAFKHGGPEQGMEVNNILTDKMVQLGGAVGGPVLIEVDVIAIAEIFKGGHIANWGIQPDIEVLARRIGYFKAKVGGVAADIPFLQAAIQPFAKFVGHFGLHGTTAGPFLQELSKFWQLKEIMGRLFLDGGGPRDC